MITRRLGATLVALPLAVSLAACGSSTTAGNPVSSGGGSSAPSTGSSAPSSAGSSAGSSSAGSSAPSGQSDNPAELVATMTAALNQVTSVRFETETSIGGSPIKGTGSQKLENGKLVALDVTQSTPVGPSQIVSVGGKSWIKQAGIKTAPGKPYRLITTTSSDPIVRQLAQTFQQTLKVASVGQAKIYLDATKSIRKVGEQDVDGTPTTLYKLVVDGAEIAEQIGLDASVGGRLGDVPVDLYLDSEGRPVRSVTKVSVQGQTISSSFTITAFDQPVTITAPPASQVTP